MNGQRDFYRSDRIQRPGRIRVWVLRVVSALVLLAVAGVWLNLPDLCGFALYLLGIGLLALAGWLWLPNFPGDSQ